MVGLLVLSCASPSGSDDLAQDSGDVQAEDDFTDLESTKEDDLGELGNFGVEKPADAVGGMPAADPELLNANIPQNVLLAPSDKEIARAAKEMAAADALKAEAEAAPATSGGDDPEFAAFDSSAKASRPRYSGPPRIPKIPGAALNRKGALLNRFYFLRKGDTTKSVSLLLYGSPNEAKNLKGWNAGSWAPGKLIYYASPSQADDREMRSFYQERNVQPEEHQIQKGETLFSLAKKKYGASGSWKEIAVINGITSLGTVEPGMRIALYPADLSGYGAAAPSNNGYRRSAPQTADAAPTETPTQPAESTPPAAYAGGNDGSALTGEAPIASPVAESFSLDFMKIFRQNMVAIVFGGGIFLLILLLGALSKQRKKRNTPSMDELGDDFTTPRRSKRK